MTYAVRQDNCALVKAPLIFSAKKWVQTSNWLLFILCQDDLTLPCCECTVAQRISVPEAQRILMLWTVLKADAIVMFNVKIVPFHLLVCALMS